MTGTRTSEDLGEISAAASKINVDKPAIRIEDIRGIADFITQYAGAGVQSYAMANERAREALAVEETRENARALRKSLQ